MPKRIIFWIAALLFCGVLTAALPMHPALRIALGVATFCLAVGTVVEFVNGSSGPDVIPGLRSSAQISVDIDQLSDRLSNLQERSSGYEAYLRSQVSEIQTSISQDISRLESAFQKELERGSENSDGQIRFIDDRLNQFDRQISVINPSEFSSKIKEIVEHINNIYESARISTSARSIIPDMKSLRDDWREEISRSPSTKEISARDNFLDEKLRETQKIVSESKDLIDVSNFDQRIDSGPMEIHIEDLTNNGIAQFTSDDEIKSWARSQARAVAIELALTKYLEDLEKLVDFARQIIGRRIYPDDMKI